MKDLLLGEVEKAIQIINSGGNSIRLPKSGTNVNMRTKMGFETIAESDSWYYLVELPKGWSVEQDTDMESCLIVDNKGRVRGNIFLVVNNDTIVAAYTTFYRRFFAIVEESVDKETGKKGRVLYILDRTNPDYKVQFCSCSRAIESFEDIAACQESALLTLNRVHPGCNDVDNWEDETLEKFKLYLDEWSLIKCNYK